jgi:hypothetical protein
MSNEDVSVVCRWAATVAETLFGTLLIAGFKIRKGLRPLRSSPFVICYGHGHRSWHQDAIRLFGLLGGCRSILTGVLGARQIHVGQASGSITLSGGSDQR